MKCPRCHKDYPQEELCPPALWLRIVAFPVMILFSMQAGSTLLEEAGGGYCRPCRRQISFCLFFFGFFIFLALLMVLISVLG